MSDLDDALAVLARSNDPAERALAQFTINRVNARREAQEAATKRAREHVYDPPTGPQAAQARAQSDGKL